MNCNHEWVDGVCKHCQTHFTEALMQLEKEVRRTEEENERFKVMYRGFENQYNKIQDQAAELDTLREQLATAQQSALDWAKRAGESQLQLNKVVEDYEAKLVTCEQGVRVEGTVESENSAIGFIQALDTLLVAYIGQRVTVIVLPEEE